MLKPIAKEVIVIHNNGMQQYSISGARSHCEKLVNNMQKVNAWNKVASVKTMCFNSTSDLNMAVPVGSILADRSYALLIVTFNSLLTRDTKYSDNNCLFHCNSETH